MRMWALVIYLCMSCDSDGCDGTPGTVYECYATRSDVLELCAPMDEVQIEQSTGWDCERTQRLYPRAVGCWYRCPPAWGCNAHHGCYCPDPPIGPIGY